MSKENDVMPSKGGDVGFHFPDEKAPPKATKLLIIQAGGCLIVSDWQDGLGHEQWSNPPKKRKSRAIPAVSRNLNTELP